MSEDTPSANALVVNAWRVHDGLQDEFVAGITELIERVRTMSGFVQGQILQGTDPTRYVSVVIMRSKSERDDAFEDPEIRQRLRGLRDIARADVHDYVTLRVFEPVSQISP